MSVDAILPLIRAKTSLQVRFGLVLGSGLGDLADALDNPVRFAYADLPGFPISGVASHAGELVIGTLEGVPVAILSGRVHYYEQGDAQAMRVPLETIKALGADGVLLTNAAGSLRDDIPPGDVMQIADHINPGHRNPLIGIETDMRFVDMTEAYDKGLRARMSDAAAMEGIALPTGVYMWFSGPSFETPAEIRMARILGADAVGMSTVPEVILARWLGLKVAGFSAITNLAAGMTGEGLSHEETMAQGPIGAGKIKRIIRRFMTEQACLDRDVAIRAIGLLDLTDLSDTCDEDAIRALAARGQTPFGPVAALCVWPQFVGFAKKELKETSIRVATVINFPHGGTDMDTVLNEAEMALEAGSDELDLVFPYQAFLDGDHEVARRMIRAVKERCPPSVWLKVILETGCLQSEDAIRHASRLAIDAGADFIKTSTGKVAVHATPEAARIMLEEIRVSGRPVGLKPSGGLKTARDAGLYLDLADEIMGTDWALSDRFRFGASSVLDALSAVASGVEASETDGGY